MDTISIIVPVYNVEKYLERVTLRDILARKRRKNEDYVLL